MKKILIFTVITVVFAGFLSADNFGTASYTLIDSYPRYSAMGKGTGATGIDAAAAGLNPAAIAAASNMQYAVMHNIWFGGITGEKLSVAKNFDFANLGLEVSYINLGSIRKMGVDEFDRPIITDDSIDLYATSISAELAKQTKDLIIGVAPKLIYDNLSESGDYYFGFDIGFIYNGLFNENMLTGFSLLNISNDDGDYSLPLNLLGSMLWTYREEGSEIITIAVSGNYLVFENDILFEAGAEYIFLNTLILRGGIHTGNKKDFGFTAGAGFRMENITVNYSYRPDPVFGGAHKISLEGNLDRPVSAPKTKGELVERGKGDFDSYMESGDYYYTAKQYSQAIKYYEYINLLYWKDVEKLDDRKKSSFYSKVGLCYYNMREKRKAKQYFDRALYYDRENEILKHWLKWMKD